VVCAVVWLRPFIIGEKSIVFASVAADAVVALFWFSGLVLIAVASVIFTDVAPTNGSGAIKPNTNTINTVGHRGRIVLGLIFFRSNLKFLIDVGLRPIAKK
jgi:hypothetical protein